MSLRILSRKAKMEKSMFSKAANSETTARRFKSCKAHVDNMQTLE